MPSKLFDQELFLNYNYAYDTTPETTAETACETE